ncbi:protocadherin Fat 4 [Strongylocentrotus purpuratus]|uniref:Cadherin domain-containing protein n=1 Tax=Strongylocentrotus purpuratus TaxID=7668 RepID=A0A7M7NG01_STRPU|nr:protocadherin Fat 4 [Strongylocentrotus purpuratus]
MARTSRTVPRIGRIGSVVPSALIFWIMVIILGECQPGVHGICSIDCQRNTNYCKECVRDPEQCATVPYYETTELGAILFNVTVDTDQPVPTDITIRISGDVESMAMFRVEGLQVILNKTFDYEMVEDYRFDIDCNDGTGWSTTPESSGEKGNAETGIVLITDVPIQAFDDDAKDYGFEYFILEDVPFNVTGPTPDGCQLGEVFLRLNGTVDFEDQEFYNFTLIAEDGCKSGFNSREGYVTVIVQVIDTDDEPPAFSQDNYDVTIPERNSTFVYTGLSASNGDSFNTPLRYSFIEQRGEWSCLYYLKIDPLTADVTIRNELDFETSPGTCIITVQAVQENDFNMVGTTNLTVTVMNVEECPSFILQSYSGQLTEDDPFVITDGGSERLIMGMTDEDGVFGGPSYIEPNDTIELVEMNMPEGTMTRFFLIKFLDPASIESDTKIQIFLSDDKADMECDSVTNVTVRLMPDGLAPNFTQSYYHGNVLENATEGTSIIQVEAWNANMTSEGIVYRLQMASDGGEDVFSVDAESGDVSVVEDGLDAEKVKQYTLIVEAVDERGTYYRYSITSVIIDVTDVNEHAPTFAEGVVEVDIEEEVPTDSSVYTVQANDLDVDAILEYSIGETAGPFAIDSKTGEISTDGRLDRDEGTTAYNITVVVMDGTNEDDCLVTITLTDINDNAPEFTGGSQALSVSENTTDTEMLQVIEATDIDEGVNAEIVYVLESPDDGLFSVDNETGMLYAHGPFDYEAVKEYTLVISASDSKFLTLTTVTVTITDVNDNAPVFISFCLNIEVLEDVGVDDVICTVGAVDDDGDGEDTVLYSLDPSSGDVPFNVNQLTGEIKTDGTLDRETEDIYIITIIAEDSGEPPLSSNTTITVIVLDVNDNIPMFAKTSITVRLQTDDLADPPVLLSRVKATDDDLAPWNITQCEKTGGEDSFVVLTGQDGSCEIYAYEELPLSTDPYSVSFYAFNPDNRDRPSANVTLTVDIRDTVCDVTFENEADDDVIVLKSELETNVPVVTLNVTSNCNSDDIVFNISSQTYRPDLDASPLPSINFTINDQTGEIFPTDIVMEGKYILLVRAYNQSDPEVSETTEVTIVVTGENTAPAFEEPFYTADITEDSMTMVIDLGPEVTDVDTPSFANGELSFSKVSETDGSGSSSDYFEVSSSGIVTTTQAILNLIKVGTFEVVVMVIDGAIEPLSNTTVVIITVDIDDQSNPVVSPPMITKDCPDQVEIEEETVLPVHICRVFGSSTYDDQVVFGLESGSEYFDIGTDLGNITTSKPFDYEYDDHSYTLLVYAEGTTSKLRNYTSFTVIVTDINDNAPVFSESPYRFSIKENAHGSTECLTFVGLIQSTDADSKINQFVTYTTDDDDFEVRDNDLMAVNCISRNSVKYATGEVRVTITALNNGTNATLTTDVNVTIEVVDINDHAPEFVNDDFSVSLEDLSTVRVIFQGDVNDMDEGPFNNESVFSLADDQDDVIYSLFHMSSDGDLTVQDIGISDEYLIYEVIIMATDMGQPPLSSSRTVTVYIGIVDVTEPYFLPSDRNQTFERKENQDDCLNISYPLICNETTYLEVYYEHVVKPESGTDLFSINETDNALSLCWKELDREVSSSYTVTLTASYVNSSMCNSINVSTSDPTRKRRNVQEVGTNTIILTIIVTDENDSPPSFQFPSNTIGTAYYLAAIDSTQFGSSVYTVIAEDADASWEFNYTLTSLSEDDVEGPENTIAIDPSDGRITTNSLLYPSLSDAWSWEWEKENNFRASRTQDPYNVTVCDTSPTSSDISQCDTTRLTFKILLSFEHIIIRFNKPVATILPQQNDIISCIAENMDPTNMLEINLQFLSPVKEDDQDMTDMWLYAVDLSKLPSSPYLKYEDFEIMWDDTEGLEECNDGTMEPRRLQLSKILPGMSTTSAIEAWVPIALGIIVFIGNLICIILLLVSWKTMHLESGRELARELTVRDEEKGIVNPVFQFDDEADDDVEIMATEAEEGATGSEEPLITTVYLTDGKTQSTIAMTANDEPKDVEKAVGTDAITIPEREYDFQEKEMDFDFEYDDKVDLNTAGMM